MKAIKNGKIIVEEEVLSGKILLFDEKIIDLVDIEDFERHLKEGLYGEDLEVIDAQEDYVSPGFIDLHVHGSEGSDTMDGEVDALTVISRAVAKNGVTSFLPTTMTMSKKEIYKALDAVKEAMMKVQEGAQILGAHMEGPFINEKCKGAQGAEHILEPDYDFIKGYENVIKIITLAPEKDKDFDFIRMVKQNTDIKLSMGHSNASFEEAVEAVERGVSRATHLFNAMSPMNHRKPGVVGAALSTKINCELIADKIHIHPGIFSLVVNTKGKEKVVLITDCMRAGGLGEGVSDLGGQKVIVKNNTATLEDGTLAGSILTLNKAVKNILENTSLTLAEAVALASLNPARDIGLEDKKGSLSKGKDADIVIFNEEFDVRQTIVLGRKVFSNC